MKLRGYATVGSVGLTLLVLDLIQRTAVAVAVKLLPSKRNRILTAWQRFLAHLMLGLAARVGGASIGTLPSIPGDPGVLILMNHQSLLDIPLVVASTENAYPRIVTRARYARGKPLISHMIRLYQYPTVDPRATVRGDLEGLEATARESRNPLVLYPEGTRSRDGSLGRWKRAGIEAILNARRWTVYLLVADGMWEAARLDDFLENVSAVDCRIRCLGPFESPPPGEPVDDFIRSMREKMKEALVSLRADQEDVPPAVGG